MKTVLIVILALAAAVLIVRAHGAFRGRSRTSKLRATLISTRRATAAAYHDSPELDALPDPVQRYFRVVLADDQPAILSARIFQEGVVDLGRRKERWVPFVADQMVLAGRPGFDWDAHVRVAPGIKVRVHDAYIAGEGILHAEILGLRTLADSHGTGDLARGELMRFLAEAAWYPTVLLPGNGVQWQSIDTTSSRATLTDGAVSVSLDVHFDANGLIHTVYAPLRHRSVEGALVATPWRGRFSDYHRRNGMLVPLRAEASWLLPQRVTPYWRGRIRDIVYEFAPADVLRSAEARRLRARASSRPHHEVPQVKCSE